MTVEPITFYQRPPAVNSDTRLFIPMVQGAGFVDLTGRHTITVGSDVSIDWTPSPYGIGSGFFEGNGYHLDPPTVQLAIPPLTDFGLAGQRKTFDFWVMFDSLPTLSHYYTMFSHGWFSGANDKYFLMIEYFPPYGGLYWNITWGNNYFQGQGAAVPDNDLVVDQWYHITIKFLFSSEENPPRCDFYRDDQLLSSIEYLHGAPGSITTDFTIGAMYGGYWGSLKGHMSYFRVIESSTVPGGAPVNFYTRSAIVNSDTKLFLPMTGSNMSTSFYDSTGIHTVTPIDDAHIETVTSPLGGGAGVFDGVKDCLVVDNQSSFGVLGVSKYFDVWVYFDALPAGSNTWTIFSHTSLSNENKLSLWCYWSAVYNSFAWQATWGNSSLQGEQYEILDTIEIGVWYNITFSFVTPGAIFRFYRDEVIKKEVNNIFGLPSAISEDFYIGSLHNVNFWFAGRMGYFRVVQDVYTPGGAPVNFYTRT